MTLELQVKLTFGTERIYPMNETAKNLCEILERKTFTRDHLTKLKEMGFSIDWIPVSIDQGMT